MNEAIFLCCKGTPKFLITYSVAGEEKTYSVCKPCAQLDCFCKHIVKKELLKGEEKK